MAQGYHDRDADLKHLEGPTVAILGDGNQGRAQALKLTDSGVAVMVGCLPGSYQETAMQDGLRSPASPRPCSSPTSSCC